MRMPQRRRGARALGPYPHGAGWRVVEVAADGSRTRSHFETEAQARAYRQLLDEQLAAGDFTTESALAEYLEHLQAKGNKPASMNRTRWAIENFFPEPLPLWAVRPRTCEQLYEALRTRPSERTGKPLAADSHRNALAEVKTFLDWCVEQRWLGTNPATSIKGVGRRSKRKPQLRIREARRWYRTALELAEDGDAGAIAALVALLMGLRASEITQRLVRDLDEDEAPGDTLWVPGSKTEKGRRVLEVPEVLRPLLLAQAEGKGRDAFLFPAADPKKHKGPRHRRAHWRDWPRLQVHRICDLAEVPHTSAHAMRGLLSTLTMRQGALGEIVADMLGHEDQRTTRDSYAAPGAADQGMRRRGLQVLEGGRGNGSLAQDRGIDRDSRDSGNESSRKASE